MRNIYDFSHIKSLSEILLKKVLLLKDIKENKREIVAFVQALKVWILSDCGRMYSQSCILHDVCSDFVLWKQRCAVNHYG